MKYQFTILKKVLSVSKIVSVHYFEYTKDYLYIGESHNFWELVYVDKGSVDIQRENQWFSLKQGQVVFHQPEEYHNLRSNGVDAPNLVVIAFQCNASAMSFFEKKQFHLSDYEKQLLAKVVSEAKEAFSSPLNDPTLKKLERKNTVLFGSEQMISSYLEQFLISIIRNMGSISLNTTTLHRKTEDGMVNDVLEFLQDNLHEKLVFQQVLDHIGVSASGLKSTFKRKMGTGVMNYFTGMKIEAAKKLIREGNLNITQISGILGFDSIHLFSRRFRQLTGMSPTEYAKSIKIEFDF